MTTSTRTSAALVALIVLALTSGGGCTTAADQAEVSSDAINTAIFGEDEATFFDQMEREKAEIVQECMAEAGFRWIPPDTTPSGPQTSSEPLDETDADYAKEYGLGISTLYFAADTVGPAAIGYTDPYAAEQGTVIEDPNTAYYDSIDQSEQIAYDETLLGNGTSEQPGCIAQAEAESARSQRYLAFQSQMTDAMASLEERINADERVTTFLREEASCLLSHGAPYASQEEAYSHLYDAMNQLSIDVGMDGGRQTAVDIAVLEHPNVGLSRPVFTPDQVDRLVRLQHDEIQTAIALSECGRTEADYQRLRSEIRTDIADDFLADYATIINQLPSD